MYFTFWIIVIPVNLIVLGYIFIEEGQGIPSFINHLSFNSRTLWNIGIIAMAITLLVKYVMSDLL